MTRFLTKQQGSKFSLRVCLFLVQTEAAGAIRVYVALPGKARSPPYCQFGLWARTQAEC